MLSKEESRVYIRDVLGIKQPEEETDLKELFIRFTASAFRKLLSIYVFSYFPFGFEGRLWGLFVSVPDHCLSFYFEFLNKLICAFYSTMPYQHVILMSKPLSECHLPPTADAS